MYNPDTAHDRQLSVRPSMAFDKSKDFASQAAAIRAKVLECLGDMPEKVELNPIIEEKTDHGTFTEYRIAFDVEKGVQAICMLCIPNNASAQNKVPLSVCVQGHGTGMHTSMGRTKYGEAPDDGDRDVGLQALERGYACLCLDQRGMGERRTEKPGYNPDDHGAPRCRTTAMSAIMLGRTMAGERCWDISRAIDLALTYPEIDGSRIICTGNSGGGTTTFYAAVFDERITVAMPSCAVCTYKDSIGAMLHCECNYIPNIAKYLDMGDIAAAIAPRALVVISGIHDPIFPKNGVDETCAIIGEIYSAAGVPEKFAHAEGQGGHRYYKKEGWEAFEKVTAGEWDK